MRINNSCKNCLIVLGAGIVLLSSGLSAAMEMSTETVCMLPRGSVGLFPENCITADQLRHRLAVEQVIVLDVRGQKSYERSHIQGASLARRNRDGQLAENLKHYPKNALIVTYCDAGCQTSSAVAIQIKRAGFKNVKVLEEGFQAWQQKGYPVSERKQ